MTQKRNKITAKNKNQTNLLVRTSQSSNWLLKTASTKSPKPKDSLTITDDKENVDERMFDY